MELRRPLEILQASVGFAGVSGIAGIYRLAQRHLHSIQFSSPSALKTSGSRLVLPPVSRFRRCPRGCKVR